MQNRIAEIRKSQNMSQEELAKKAGISRSAMVYVESGSRDSVSTKTLQKIADALGVPFFQLFNVDQKS